MIWKKWAIWYRGAIIGLIVGFIVSIGLAKNNGIWSVLSSPGLVSCRFVSQCSGVECLGCTVIGLMLNLIYGFIIGAIIGLLIQKSTGKKPDRKFVKNKRRKK